MSRTATPRRARKKSGTTDEAGKQIASALWAIHHSLGDLVDLMKYQQAYLEASLADLTRRALAAGYFPSDSGHAGFQSNGHKK